MECRCDRDSSTRIVCGLLIGVFQVGIRLWPFRRCYNKPMRQRRVIWGNGLVGYKLTISFSKCVALCRVRSELFVVLFSL
jgi:hypothetical protein